MKMIAPHKSMELQPAYQPEVEALVSDHFQSMYAVLKFFVEAPQESIHLAEDIFRATISQDEITVVALYRNALERLEGETSDCSLLSLMTAECALCWLLKELGGLRYHEIATAIKLDATQVKMNIATARPSLLPLV